MNFLSDFGVKPILLAAQVVNFLILLFILNKLLYKPILKVLAQRKQKIEESLKNAQEIELKLAQTNEKIDQMMAKASSDVQKILDEAKKARIQILEEAHQKAAQDGEKIIQKSIETSKLEMEKMMAEGRLQLFDLAAEIFNKVTGKAVTTDEQKKLFEREVKNLS